MMCKTDTIIYVPTFNRKALATECLSNLQHVRKDARLFVTDDCSTEHFGTELIMFGTEGERLNENVGIDFVRWRQLQQFISTGLEYCYFTDSDTLHDVNALDRLRFMFDSYRYMSSIYNSNSQYHKDGDVLEVEGQDILFRKSIPGCSMFFDREHAMRITSYLKDAMRVWGTDCLNTRYGQWDWAFCFAVPAVALSKISYCDHIAVDGIHSSVANDRALAPTPYLRNLRKDVLGRLGYAMV